ncbi:MAG: DUF748 domain-containing protein [Candidatus Omnitrophota bacterium]
MKRLLIILGISLFLISLLVAGFFYLKTTYVPKILRILIERSIQDSTNLKIKLGEIRYELFKGVIIEDIKLFSESQAPENAPISINKISFNILLLPSFKGKSIIIPTLYVDQPRLSIERQKDLTWNFEHFLKEKLKPAKPTPPLVIVKIKVSQGEISINDPSVQPNFLKQFNNLNLDMAPGGFKDIIFRLSAELNKSRIFIDGKFNQSKQILALNCETKNLQLADTLEYLNALEVSVNSFLLENAKAAINYSFDSADLKIETKADIADFDIKSNEVSIRGAGKLSFNGLLNQRSKKRNPQFSANLELENTRIDGLKDIGSLEKIKAKITIKDYETLLETFEGLWQGDLIKASGESHVGLAQIGLEAPPSTLDIYSDKLNIEKLISFLPKESAKTIEKISGTCSLKAHLQLNPAGKSPIQNFSATLDIKDTDLKLMNFAKEISKINGNLSITNDNLGWNNIDFIIDTYELRTSGSLENLQAPKLKFDVSSKVFNAKVQGSLQKDKLNLESLNIDSFGSSLKATGQVNFIKEKSPLVDLNLEINLLAENLVNWLSESQDLLKQLSPQGAVKIKATVSGPAFSLADCELNINGDTKLIKIYGLNFNNLTIKYDQRNNTVNNLAMFFDAYGGTFSLSGGGRIYSNDLEMDLTTNIDNIDIAKLKMDTPFKDKEISGLFFAKTNINFKKDILETLKGDGEIKIKDGIIWDFRPFKGLAEFLVLPEFSHIVFNQGEASFTINNKRLYSEDLSFISPQMTFNATGSLGFDGTLDFDATCTFDEKYLLHSSDLRKLITEIFTQLRENISIKITGTIKNPEYKVIPLKIKDIISPLKDLFKF